MDLQKVLSLLMYNNGIFPLDALKSAIKQKDAITPELLRLIQFSTERTESLVQEEDYMAPIYAMYLLAQFREKRAFEELIRFFSISDEHVLFYTEDVVTDDLSRILASVYDGNIELLKGLIENEDIDGNVRGAGLLTFPILVKSDRIARSDAIAYFETLFKGTLKKEFSNVWTALVEASTLLYPDSLYEEIENAFRDDLVEVLLINRKEVNETLEKGEEAVLASLNESKKYALIDDTIGELSKWECYEKPRTSKKISQPVKRGKKVGRNDPCPCGNGKKYKKCCLNKT